MIDSGLKKGVYIGKLGYRCRVGGRWTLSNISLYIDMSFRIGKSFKTEINNI